MAFRIKSAFLLSVLLLNLALTQNSWSQQPANDKDTEALEARGAVGTILLSGLVGGILGLSTLSFYKEPQDHIRNITFGAGAGMILSVIYLTVQAAGTPMQVDDDKPKSGSAFVYPDYNGQRVALVGTFQF